MQKQIFRQICKRTQCRAHSIRSMADDEAYVLSEPVENFASVCLEEKRGITMDGGEKNYLMTKKLVFTNPSRGTTFEVFPLYLTNVGQWYIQRILTSIRSNENYSTVYLASPFVTVDTTDPKSQRAPGLSLPVALELSFTQDFPAKIFIPDIEAAPTFVQLCPSKADYLLGFASRNPNKEVLKLLNVLTEEREGKFMHEKDAVCLVTSPDGMKKCVEHFQARQADGWEMRTEELAVSTSLNRAYGIFLNVFGRAVKCLIALFIVYNLNIPFAMYKKWQLANEYDARPKEMPADKIVYINTGYKPEQEVVLDKLQAVMYAAPPGSGVDDRVHNTFFNRALTFENVAAPKPLLPRDVPVMLKSGKVLDPKDFKAHPDAAE